ncbi:DUF2267 domain-containing protein [Actinoallomurus purpureus]|uniref:DUF2267 domain-containing protein n=1 Tax=Actinoallomurus purpureus TaxID=478114 RepID=UPI0020931694|nr:DUF2267 domain-containing protein [Actinoallomurus purpureus]MCO6008154.1 DUF2267 domain-containing protein [Actinoallomurus purpureus]
MDYREFIQVTQREGGIDGDLAERAARATLTTLAKRLSPGQARGLLERLPAEMKPWLHTQRVAEGFDVDEFLCRVAEREGVDVETTERHAHAVFFALGRAVSRDEIADVADELPSASHRRSPRPTAGSSTSRRTKTSWPRSPNAPASTPTRRSAPPRPYWRRSPSASPVARWTT